MRVSGFAVPPPAPIPMPVGCNFRIGIVYANPSGVPANQLYNEVSAEPDVATVGMLGAGILTPTLASAVLVKASSSRIDPICITLTGKEP